MILARTVKGRGVLRGGQQGRLARQGRSRPTRPTGPSPSWAASATWWSAARSRTAAAVAPPAPAATPNGAPAAAPEYALGDKDATRKAYGDALVALGADRPEVVALDGEVSNSTHADEFKKAYPDRFFEMFIAEQQMVAAAVGLGVLGIRAVRLDLRRLLHPRLRPDPHGRHLQRRPSTCAARTPACSIGEDGPSQMALEDLAMMRAVYGSTVLYPCDATRRRPWSGHGRPAGHLLPAHHPRRVPDPLRDPARASRSAARRCCGPATGDAVTLIGAGVTLHACLAAADQLAADGISARVIDLYSVKPVDTETLLAAVAATGGRLVVVEDHYPEGGLGAAVTDALLAAGPQTLRVAHLAVRELPGSGTSAELLAAAGIDAPHIAAAARDLLA